MHRIFSALAISEVLLLLGTAALGFLKIDPQAERHVLLAVMALLLSCLIQVLAFTFLTVTGKSIVQAVHLGHLDPEPIIEVKRFKRQLTFCLAGLVCLILIVVATGASQWALRRSGTAHMVSAAALLVLHGVVLAREYFILRKNESLLEQTMELYRNRRSEHVAEKVILTGTADLDRSKNES